MLPVMLWLASIQAAGVAAETAELSWTDLSGHSLGLEELRGRVVVLNFWATWCAPCRKEMPHLTRVQRRYGIYGVQVLGAAADASDQRAAVLDFARHLKIDFPVVVGATTEQMQSLGLGVSLPATVVLDREGRVVERFEGIFEPTALKRAVERALDLDPGDATHVAHRDHGDHADHEDHVHIVPVGPTQASLVPS